MAPPPSAQPTSPRSVTQVRNALGEALNDGTLMTTIITLPTLPEATAALLVRVGVRTSMATAESLSDRGVREEAIFVGGVVAGDEMGATTLRQQTCELWISPPSTPSRVTGLAALTSGPGLRLGLVQSAARGVASGNMSATEILSDPDLDARPESVAFRTAMVGAWWEARLAEGHTPESARFLLGLTANPLLLSRLRAARDTAGAPTPFLDAS